ncbi:MAG: hypothetical protein ACOYBE_05250 [Blautia sp.]|jgi:D-alanyl-D-alanine carboxypeptidase
MKKLMKRLGCLLLCFLLAAGCALWQDVDTVSGAVTDTVTVPFSRAAAKPTVSSRAAYLWDITDNEVLYDKAAQVRYGNASTTKIMTAIVVLEHLKPGQMVTFSANAASREPTKLWANVGEQFYVKDLLYSLLVPSHNDTAVAFAERVAGSEAAFARMMNQKAAAIGCKNTNFITANGLDADVTGHGSTARDLAVMLKYGIQKSRFLDVISTPYKMIQSINTKRSFSLYTTFPEFYQMAGAIGGKTGYTNKAGHCFAGLFERSGHKFIVVTLGAGSSSARWNDVAALMNYAGQYRAENPTRSVTISWDPVEDAQGYTVWYKLNGASAYTRAGVTTKTTYTQYGLAPGATYRFSVKPWVKEDGKYIFGPVCSKTDGVTKPEPARIASVTANDDGDLKVRLAGKAKGAQKYAMCYSKSSDYSGMNFKVGIRTSFTTRTMVKGLEAGDYYVRVRSYVELKDKTRVYAAWSPAVKVTVD